MPLTRSDLADLNVFIVIVRRRSFRHAAAELGVSTSALSHTMRHLEARLGVKLLNRTSRSVAPTTAGAALAEHLDAGFARIEEAVHSLERYRGTPTGRLRINVPRDASRLLLSPVLAEFFQAYPELNLDLTVEDRMVDIVEEGYDAGIRYGDTVPQDMVAVPLTGPLRWVVVGSPAYIKRHGRPSTPEDLSDHACVRMRLGDNTLYRWELALNGRIIEMEVPGPVTVNETEAVVAAAVDGIALAYCLQWRIRNELAAGTLVDVLPDHAVDGPPMVMYYPSRRQAHAGLKHLVEMLRARYQSLHAA